MKTSKTNPLILDHVAVPGGGAIAMTLCPGKRQLDATTGPWDRDLAADLRVIVEWRAAAVVTLMPTDELARVGVPGIGEAVEALGLEWHHLPIVDFQAPDAAFERRWLDAGPRLRAHLRAGRRLVLHCRGGLGRAGTIAARLLIEMGEAPAAAIQRVRAARPGAIETEVQQRYVLALSPTGGG